MGIQNAALPRDASSRLEELYNTWLPAVYGYTRARLRQQDAEDVTAEVFRAASERLRADHTAELSRSWFLTVARNLIIDRWRREARWQSRLAHLQREAAERARRPIGEGDERVFVALDTVAPQYRTVLVLHYLEGHSVNDIASRLGRTRDAIDSLLARARRALVAAFEEFGP